MSKGISLLVTAMLTLSAFGIMVAHGPVTAGFSGTAVLLGGGNGTVENPYVITDVWEMHNMIADLTAHYALGNHIDASDTGNWEDVDGIGFMPIGNPVDQFTGSLDGRGYLISGLYINRPEMDYVGLFGCINNAEVKNIGLSETDGMWIQGNDYVGGLVGRAWGTSMVMKSFSEGTIIGESQVGGLIGSTGNNVVVEDCYATGPVYGDLGDIGGLVGLIGGSSQIINCYAAGLVDGPEPDIGGLVGRKIDMGDVQNSYYDYETTGRNDTGKGEPKSTAEMQTMSTFIGWDMSGVWWLEDGSGYPILRWQITKRGPIRINSNTGFTTANGVRYGDGSAGNPWIIDGWEIDGTGHGYGIYIGNTTEHFVVRDCHLYNASGGDFSSYFPNGGLVLYNVTNGSVINNIAVHNNQEGIHLRESRNITISDNTVSGNRRGIYVFLSSTGNTIFNNIAVHNTYGLEVAGLSDGNVISNNTISDNIHGSYISGSGHCLISNNTVSNSAYSGLWLSNSHNMALANNVMFNDGISISGDSLENWNSHDIPDTNTVNGKPVLYLKDQSDMVIGPGRGQVILANCTGMTVENQNYSNGSMGIALGFSSHSILANNTVNSNNWAGISITNSHNVMAENNTALGCRNGIYIRDSDHNFIIDSTLTNNNMGIEVYGSHHNHILDNDVSMNDFGCYIGDSSYNTFEGNDFSGNVETVSVLLGSSNNTLAHNNFHSGSVTDDGTDNIWNLTYPGGGNYWAGHTGPDDYMGPGQDIPGSDGIVDNNYTVPGTADAKDHYPWTTPNGWETPPVEPVENQDTGERFWRIQDAIDDEDTENGHTIFADSGGYHENVWINKRINLVGHGSANTVVYGGGTGSTITIAVNGVNITGFKVTGSGGNYGNAGIEFHNTNIRDCIIEDNNLTGNWAGISMPNSLHNTITCNEFFNNSYSGALLTGATHNEISHNNFHSSNQALFLQSNSNLNDIVNNTVRESSIGIQLHSSNENTISHCRFLDNSVYGIYLAQTQLNNISHNNASHNNLVGIVVANSGHTDVTWNTASHNGNEGIILTYSHNFTLSNNTVSGNISVGINVFDSRDSGISDNVISHSTYGIIVEDSDDNTFVRNTVENNDHGFRLLSSARNRIYHNSILGNTNQAYDDTGTNHWHNGYPSGGNYWSDYTGVDEMHGINQNHPGSDGMGDTPYNIDGDAGVQDRYPLMQPWFVDNEPPVADAGPDQTVDEGQPMHFNGTASTDNRGIVNYTWTFTDGVSRVLYGSMPAYTFLTPGNYTVTLTVRDAAGHTHTDTLRVNVRDITPPVANAGPDRTVDEGSTVYFDAWQSNDNVGIVNYTWNFTYNGSAVILYDMETTFVFVHEGVYAVTLTVRDADGNTDTDTVTIVVDSIPPVANAGPDQTVDEDEEVTFDGSGSTDNLGIANWTWICENWDLGIFFTIYGETAQYTFEKPGEYVVTLRVTDVAGMQRTDTVTITVLDITPPTVNLEYDPIISQGDLFYLSVWNYTDNVGVVGFQWSFTYDGALVTLDGQNVDFRFNIAGEYLVTLRVEDAAGNWATDTMTLFVLDTTAPVANAGPNQAVEVGTLVTFDGSNSTDNVGIVNYTWEFYYDGEPVFLYGVSPSFRFNITGYYSVSLMVLDQEENAGYDYVEIHVTHDGNGNGNGHLPVADAGPDQTVNAGDTVDFDGTGSFDSEGITEFYWNFDYHGEPITLEGPTPRFKFEIPGVYQVTLSVENIARFVDSDTVVITVMEEGEPGNGDNGDPDGDDENGVALGEYTWIILIIVAVAVIGAVAGLMLMKKGKKPDMPEEARQPPEAQPPEQRAPPPPPED